jgi:hypothetical protein
MRPIFTFLNDYRDTLFYSFLLVFSCAGILVAGWRGLSMPMLLWQTRELCRLSAWGLCREPKKVFLFPASRAALVLVNAISIMHGITHYPVYGLTIIVLNLTIMAHQDLDLIRHFGARVPVPLAWVVVLLSPLALPPARRMEEP